MTERSKAVRAPYGQKMIREGIPPRWWPRGPFGRAKVYDPALTLAIVTTGVSTRDGVGGRRHRRRRRAEERKRGPSLRQVVRAGEGVTSAAYWLASNGTEEALFLSHASPGGPMSGLLDIIKQKKAARLLAGTEVTLGGMVGSIGLREGWPR